MLIAKYDKNIYFTTIIILNYSYPAQKHTKKIIYDCYIEMKALLDMIKIIVKLLILFELHCLTVI